MNKRKLLVMLTWFAMLVMFVYGLHAGRHSCGWDGAQTCRYAQ